MKDARSVENKYENTGGIRMRCNVNREKPKRNDNATRLDGSWFLAIAKAAYIAQLFVLIVVFFSSACCIGCFLGSEPLHVVYGSDEKYK